MAQVFWWIDNRRMLRRFLLKGIIVARTPIRIGSGRGAVALGSPIDQPILRRGVGGPPYIPGTSLKGAFRSTAERLAHIKEIEVCTGLARQTCVDAKRVDDMPLLQWLDRKRREIRSSLGGYSEQYEELLEVAFQKTCLNCKLFGAPSMSGRLYFFDADPISGDSYKIGSRTGIAIGRDTGAAAHGALYQMEYLEPGSELSFMLEGVNVPNYGLGLIAAIIEEFNRGHVRIGGLKSRGFGLVEFKMGELVLLSEDKLTALDEYDRDVDVEPGTYSGYEVAKILGKFIEVWNGVELGYPS